MQLVEHIIGKMQQDSRQVWIYPLDAQWLRAYAQEIANQNPADLPLYGIPFAIKLAGVPTNRCRTSFMFYGEQLLTTPNSEKNRDNQLFSQLGLIKEKPRGNVKATAIDAMRA